LNGFLEHKGYRGTIEYSLEDNLLFGKVIGIRDLISYEGESLSKLQEDFAGAIDDYLIWCEQDGVEPAKPFNGCLGEILISPDIHERLYAFSGVSNQKPGTIVEEALKQYIG